MPEPEPAGLTKRSAGTGGGAAFAVILVWVLELNGLEVPPEVGIAFGAVFTIVGNWLMKRFG